MYQNNKKLLNKIVWHEHIYPEDIQFMKAHGNLTMNYIEIIVAIQNYPNKLTKNEMLLQKVKKIYALDEFLRRNKYSEEKVVQILF